MPLPASLSGNNLSSTHAHDLNVTRSLITTLISALEREFITPALYEISSNEKALPSPARILLWGEKENAVGALVKLTGLLLKVIPLEQQLAGNPIHATEDEPLSPEDHAIVARYVERITGEKRKG